jgi:hypothetical protein
MASRSPKVAIRMSQSRCRQHVLSPGSVCLRKPADRPVRNRHQENMIS